MIFKIFAPFTVKSNNDFAILSSEKIFSSLFSFFIYVHRTRIRAFNSGFNII